MTTFPFYPMQKSEPVCLFHASARTHEGIAPASKHREDGEIPFVSRHSSFPTRVASHHRASRYSN